MRSLNLNEGIKFRCKSIIQASQIDPFIQIKIKKMLQQVTLSVNNKSSTNPQRLMVQPKCWELRIPEW